MAPLVEDPTMLKLWRQAVRSYDTLADDDGIRVSPFLDRDTDALAADEERRANPEGSK